MNIIAHRKIWLSFSGILFAISVFSFLIFGLKLSADFTEGTLLSLKFTQEKEKPVAQEEFRKSLESFKPSEKETLSGFDLKKSSDGTFILRLKRLSPEVSDAFLAHIKNKNGEFELLQSRNVSPLFAQKFRNNALLAIFAASIMIVLYITFAFRKVSRGIKSWKLGISAILALIHDVTITVGLFVLLGVFLGIEIDILFITALLSIMGFSVHDTIVVFDRVRENLLTKHYQEQFEETAEKAIQQTLARSINTSFSAVLVLIPLMIFGASEIFYFALAMTFGIIIGTYSSIFVATPLLIYFQKSES